jgi:hypothetical protein
MQSCRSVCFVTFDLVPYHRTRLGQPWVIVVERIYRSAAVELVWRANDGPGFPPCSLHSVSTLY